MAAEGFALGRKKLLKPNKQSSLSWYFAHLDGYLKLNYRVLRNGIPLREILILKYPLLFPDAGLPPLLSVDFTDYCNLRCLYCYNPYLLETRSFMSEEVFSALLAKLDNQPVNRIRISGGEPTLHPQLGHYLSELAKRCRFLSLISNGQWMDEAIADTILRSGVSLIELSLDAGGTETYEKSRPGASYNKFMTNLIGLARLKKKLKVQCLIKIRLMLRPSTLSFKTRESTFLKRYCDIVLPQFILQHPDTPAQEDIFLQQSHQENSLPVCGVPFRDLQVRPDGKIPLCPAKGSCRDFEKCIFIGDIMTTGIKQAWSNLQLRKMRQAQRQHRGYILQLCRNCHYG